MLAKQFRLPATLVFTKPRVYKELEFLMKIQENNLSHARFGFVVSKKIDTRSVVRNRLKRVVRSFFEQKWVDTIKGKDILLILKKEALLVQPNILQNKIDMIMTTL